MGILKMRVMKLLIILTILLSLPIITKGQAWSGIIDPARAVDWSQAGIPGGVPSGSWANCITAACNTLWNGGVDGVQVTAANINSAVTSATGSSTVVRVPGSGVTRILTSGISMKNNVVVRGQGADQTILAFSGTAGCGYQALVCLAPSTIPSPGDEKNVCNWTSGYAKGTTTITLANCGSATPALGSISNLQVGNLIFLDQIDDSNTDTGNIWICATINVCGNTVPGGGQRTNGGTVSSVSNRSQQQTVTVTSCDGNFSTGHVCASGAGITISPGLYMPNWRSGQLPQAWYGSAYTFNAGVENLTINACTGTVTVDGAGNSTCSPTTSPQANVVLAACSNCWVQGVRSMWAPRAHVTMDSAAHSEVRDSYFYQSQSHASVSYTVEILWAGSDNKVENNISQQVTDSMPNCNGGCEGNVFSYNFAIDDVWVQSSGWMQASFYQHASGDTYNLWEGNIGPGYTADQVHGTHTFETIFRNRLVGNQAAGCGSAGVNTCSNQTIPVHLYAGSRYFNVIGNVLGQSGYHNNYTALGAASSAPSGDTSIYTLGASGNGGNPYSPLSSYCLDPTCATHGDFDPQVSNYLMRWGNYDTFTTLVKFVNGEVPSTLSLYANPIPASQALPASFYLSSRPSWFGGSIPYPPIGPDVTGGNLPNLAGHANMNPAMSCFANTMLGPANGTGPVLSFNATTCYASAATSPAVSLSPSNISFPNQAKGTTSSSQIIVLTNTGTATLTITSITLTGTNPSNFSIPLNTCGATLTPSSSCSVSVTFNPTSLISFLASLTFTTNAPTSPDNASLSGTGALAGFVTGAGGISGAGVIHN